MPQERVYRKQLCTAAKEIYIQNAKDQLKEASKEKKREETEGAKEARKSALRGCSNVTKFEGAVEFAMEGLDLERWPRLDRQGKCEIKVQSRRQANERERVITTVTANLWGWKDPTLTKLERLKIAKAAC